METKYNGHNVNTDNKGWLEHVGEFNSMRGEHEYMGQAKDDEGKIYNIFSAPCSISTCHCWATAEEI